MTRPKVILDRIEGSSVLGAKDSITVDLTDNKVLLVNDQDSPGNNKVYGTNNSGNKGWLDITEQIPTVVLNTGSYSNPTWITSLAWGKITGTPTTLSGYNISDGVSTGGSYADPAWITSLTYAKLTGTPSSLPPTGSAGGSLTGSYPNPGINYDNVTINNVGVSTVIQVKDGGINESKLNTSVAGNGLSGGGGTPLSINVDASTIEINTDTLRVKDAGITVAKLNSGVVDNATLEISGTLRLKDGGIQPVKLVGGFDSTANTGSGGAAQTIATVPTITNTTCTIEATLIGKWVSGSDGTGSGSGRKKIATYKNISGTVTQIGTTSSIHSVASTGNSPDLIFTISGSNILVQGQAGSGEVYSCRVYGAIKVN